MEATLLAEAFLYLEHWLDYRQRTLRIPGLVAAVSLDGRLLLHRAYGLADLDAGTPLQVDAVFPVASHSKTFTTALALRLVDQGRVRLDDRLGQWLPELDAGLHGVRVGELLSHSAGVTRDTLDADFWQLRKDFPDADELTDAAESVLGRHERFKYSNIGFSVVGRVIEAVAGASYAEVAQRELLDVLGLAGTSTDTTGRTCPVGYTARRGGADRHALPLPAAAALAPATGYCSTASELCSFATALCDGDDRLLSEEARRLMRRVAWPGEHGDTDYCLGLSHSMIGERHVHGHGGAYPGFITSTRFIAADRVAAVVLSNAIDAPSQELTATMLALVDHAQQCGPSEPLAPGITGRYSGIWGTYDVVRFGGQLLAFDPELIDPLERRIELTAESESTWTITRSSGYGSPGEQVVFDGETCRFAGMTLQREAAW
jgi:CubicO group peptidase (beta-lactamase class C family)